MLPYHVKIIDFKCDQSCDQTNKSIKIDFRSALSVNSTKCPVIVLRSINSELFVDFALWNFQSKVEEYLYYNNQSN